MNIRHIAVAAVALAAGQAFALNPTDSAAAVQVHMSGASAMRNLIGGLFTENCAAGTLDTYYSAIGTFSGIAFTAAGDAHRVYTCTMSATSPILPSKNVALYKSDIGGSGQGVFPVQARSSRNFLNLSTCGAKVSGTPNYTCTGEQSTIPMAGVSDVEPRLFKGVNVPKDDPSYPADGLTDDQIAEMEVNPLFQTIFAVAVNKSLRDAMQTAQSKIVGSDADVDQPSISRVIAASYFSGALSDPSTGLGWQLLVNGADPKKATQVNICRRVDGSGTQASANAELLGFPCNGNALTLADKGISDVGPDNQALSNVTTTGKVFVYEGSSTGNVVTCLNTAETNAAYAIGHVSKENVPATTGAIGNWRHVSLDGAVPSRDNVKAGKYGYFFESTMQWNKAQFATLSADQKAFLTTFAARARLSDSLAKLSASTQNGVAAMPDTYAGAYGTGSANEIKFGSRVTRGGNSCTPATVAK